MKKILTTLALTLSIIATTTAQPMGQRGAQRGSEALLISTMRDGDYTINRYLVMERSSDNNEFTLRYKINLAKLISSYDKNATELDGLRGFINEFKQDSLKRITAINVVGCASPDGQYLANERLSEARAMDFRNYLDKNCDLSSYPGTTTGKVYTWSDAEPLISKSTIPNKAKVLEIVKSNIPAAQIESKLRAMPESWSYLCKEILPTMRGVELHVRYNSWRIVEERIITSRGREREEKRPQYIIMMIEQQSHGNMVELPTAPLDYDEDKVRVKYKSDRRRTKLKERERVGFFHRKWRSKRKY